MNNDYIACVASKSGGHIIPCLSYAKKNYGDKKILFFSNLLDIDKEILSNYNIDRIVKLFYISLSFSKNSFNKNDIYFLYINRLFYILLHIIKFSFSSIFNILLILIFLIRYKPTKVIHTGGIIAISVCIVAKFLKIEICTYELNAVFGKANRFLSKISDNIYVCFQSAKKDIGSISNNVIITDYPIRFDQSDIKNRLDALKYLSLNQDKKTIFILGGSQGSSNINNIMKDVISSYGNYFKNFNILHQTGSLQKDEIEKFYRSFLGDNFVVFNYRHDLNYFYCAADLIISRAGAGSIFEAIFFNKKSILIPLSLYDNHQIINAQNISKEYPHLFQYFIEKDLTKRNLYSLILCQLS